MQSRTQQVVMPNAQIMVRDLGRGAPILFLHGNPDSGHLWLEAAQQLSTDYRCLVPDLPGFGRSTADAAYDLSLENRGQYVQHILEALHITEPVTVVVHDHGGPFGLTWALQHPEQVRALCLLNTLYHADYHWHFWGQVWRTPLLGEMHIASAGIPGLIDLFMLLEMRYHGGSRGLSRDHIAQTARLFTAPVRKMMLKLYRQTPPRIFAGWDQRLLALVSQKPTLVLWGRRDPYIPTNFPERLKQHGAQVQFYPEYGHWLMAENPTLIADEIRALMQRTLP